MHPSNTRPPCRTIYGVFEVPTYMADERRVDSAWEHEQDAVSRATNRSYQIHGRVFVVAWTLNRPGTKTISAFVDGRPAPVPYSWSPRAR